MADGVFRFPGAGPYLYQPQNQQPHNPRHFQHQRHPSPVNNPRIGFHANDTPSPNRSPGTHSPAFNMFSHGQHQSQHSLLNGGQPHHRYQMQMNMPKGYPGSASQHQGAHGQHQHLDHSSTNGYGNHQHNMSSSTLTSSTPHFTPAHLQSSTPVGNHSSLSRPNGAHWDEQIRVAQQTREAIAPHYYARNSSGVNKQNNGGLQDDTKKDDDKTRKLKPLQGAKEEKHIWDALDFSGQGLRSISSFLFRYPFLESLYFNRNKLSWLTPQIGQLKCLTYLDLSQNHLDSLPGEIGMLTNLKTLLLVDNNLESLPFELGYLYKLKTLGIDGNPLNEDIRNIIAEEGISGLVSYMKENAESKYNLYHPLLRLANETKLLRHLAIESGIFWMRHPWPMRNRIASQSSTRIFSARPMSTQRSTHMCLRVRLPGSIAEMSLCAKYGCAMPILSVCRRSTQNVTTRISEKP